MAKDPFGRSSEYHEDLDRIMQYVEMQVNSQGVHYKVESERQLSLLIDRLPKGSRGDVSPQFRDALMLKGYPSRYVGRTIGKFGSLQRIQSSKADSLGRGVVPVRVAQAKQKGGRVFRTREKDRFALRITYKTRTGKDGERYSDVGTGKFIKKSVVEDEL